MKENYIKLIVGFILFIAGFTLMMVLKGSKEYVLKVLPFLFIGSGSGVLGISLGEIKKVNKIKNNDKKYIVQEIERNDERNKIIVMKAKAKAFDVMIIVYSIIMMILVLMSVNIKIIVLMICGQFVGIISSAYFSSKYSKEI